MTTSTVRRPLVLCLSFLCAVPSAFAEPGRPRLVLRGIRPAGADHLVATLEALDAAGAPLAGLPAAAFQVFEQGGARPLHPDSLQTVAQAEARLELAIVLQSSGAYRGVAEPIRAGLGSLGQSLPAGVAVGLLAYGDSARWLLSPTQDRAALTAALSSWRPEEKGADLGDALALARAWLAEPGASAPRALLWVADGRDLGSATSAEGALSALAQLHAPIFAVGHSEVEPEPLARLEALCAQSEGLYVPAPDLSALPVLLDAVRARLAGSYRLGWRTALPHDNKDHRVELVLASGKGAAGELRAAAMVVVPERHHRRRWIALGALVIALAAAARLVRKRRS